MWEYQGKRLRIMEDMSRIAKAKPQAASRMIQARRARRRVLLGPEIEGLRP